MSKDENIGAPEKEVLNDPAFQYHYNYASGLLAEIPGMEIKGRIIEAITISCLTDTRMLTEENTDLLKFDIKSIRDGEFPDDKLSFLKNKLPGHFFYDLCNKIINAVPDIEIKELIIEVFQGNKKSGKDYEKVKELEELLVGIIHQALFREFYGTEMNFINPVAALKIIKEKVETQLTSALKEISYDNLRIDKKNNSPECLRNIALRFEREGIRFTDSTLPCRILIAEGYEEIAAKCVQD